jgi:cytochrome d ubiquinol oxidase subunit II
VAAIGGLFVIREDAPDLYDGLTSGAGLALVLVSAVAGLLTLVLVWVRRFGLARLSAAVAVAAIIVGWAVAQSPYVLPPRDTLDEAAASDATLTAVVVVVGIGMVVLIPSLTLLYRLVLKGQLDQRFEPLDQRFRPLTASDHPRPRP